MPNYRVTAPDGVTYNVTAPEGATDAQIAQMVQRQARNAPKPTSFRQGVKVGTSEPMYNLARAVESGSDALGIKAPLKALGNALTAPFDLIGDAIGLPGGERFDSVNAAQSDFNARQDLAPTRPSGFGKFTGNVLGTLPSAVLGGGPLIQGGLTGALLTDKRDLPGIAYDAGLGAVSSKVVGKGLDMLGRAVSPVVDKGAKALYDMGVRFTPGQLGQMAQGTGGRLIAGVENAAGRLPFVKPVINAARERGQNAYYQAVLKKTGVEVPENIPAGHEAHSFIGKQLSNAYTKLLPNLRVSADPKLVAGLAAAESKVKGLLPPEQYKQFVNTLKYVNLRKTKGFGIDGKTYQQAEQTLRGMADDYWKAYARSRQPADRAMAEGYSAVLDQMRGVLLRQNPKYAPQLSKLNKQWRELSVIRRAAGDENSLSGVFTPAQYSRAARGSKSNQQVTRTANQFLTNRAPDSGTTEGVGLGQLLLGGSTAAGAIHPALAIPGAGATLYTKPGQQMLNYLVFAERNKAAKAAGKGIRQAAKLAPIVAPPLLAPVVKPLTE